MPRYTYNPLATQEGQSPAHSGSVDEFNKKRDICLGFIILSSIVYVLARAGGRVDCNDVLQQPQMQTQMQQQEPLELSQHSSSHHIIHHDAPHSSDKSPFTVPEDFDMGAYRESILSQSKPYIIECIEAGEGGSQEACHLSREKRYAALNQKGITLWMTGLSGSGKSTIAALLEEQLVTHHGKAVYRLDGDNIRTGLNRDLGFSKADRAESVRRVGELACLFSDSGSITIVSLVSPYKADRDMARKRHEEQGLKFLEVFMDVPLKIVQDRDPKGLYKKVAAGELKGFTGVDDPYEPPEDPEVSMKNYEMSVQEAVDVLMRALREEGVLVGGPTLPKGLPYPDGDEIIDRHATKSKASRLRDEMKKLPKALLTDIDVNWLQTIAEGWAAPLKGFMREGELLQTLHFNSILVDPHNLTGTKDLYSKHTNMQDFDSVPPKRVSMSVPIVLPCTEYTKLAIEKEIDLMEGTNAVASVALMGKHGQFLGVLRNPEIYANRKEEIVSRLYGVIDMGHPYIKHIYTGGDWLIGGEIELVERIRYNDGLDKWRLTAPEVMKEFEDKKADSVFAFQTRNPTHAGHAYLMRTGRDMLLKRGFSNPILWLSPLGGWTKSDDVPLDVRVKQHEAVLADGQLNPKTTVMAIWPAPMIYAGPTEVLFHAKSRRNAGATFFVAGRDPAGMKGSSDALSHPDDDLYDGDHGRYVLTMSPGQDPMEILQFGKVYYDKRDHVMKDIEMDREDDFISISGSKMRALARAGATPCDVSHGKSIPSDLLGENCIPPGFMVQEGWEIVCDYYQNVDSTDWVPYSVMNVDPFVAKATKHEGRYGTMDFKLYPLNTSGKRLSAWHDISLWADKAARMVNFVIEIPMHSTAKMEMMKNEPGNPIMQDTKDDAPRYYSYGTPFFNYGLLPQTWENSHHTDPHTGAKGDNDPIDAIEVGEGPLAMGDVVSCRVLGAMELIDEGETDHKIIVIRSTDKHFDRIHSVEDLDRYKPGVIDNLVDWLKNYKTSDGKPVNRLAQEEPTSAAEAMDIIDQVSDFYDDLISGNVVLSDKEEGFYLPSK